MYNPSFSLKSDRVPILSNNQIERDAMLFVNDFDSDMFRTPHALDIDRFAEFYLGLDIEYLWLRQDDSRLGEMIFHNIKNFPVYNPIALGIKEVCVKEGTILIHSGIEKKEHLRRMTIAHECAHWIYHKDFFTPLNGCAEADESSFSVPHDSYKWLEHHAGLFSACLLMPRKPFFMVVTDPHLRELAWNDIYVTDLISCGDKYLASTAARIFDVSVAAATVRLKQLGCDLVSEACVKNSEDLRNILRNAEDFNKEVEKRVG